MTDGKLFTVRALKAGYQTLQKEMRSLGLADKSRTTKIRDLKRELLHTRDHLRLSEVRKRILNS